MNREAPVIPDDPLRVLIANDHEWAGRSLESILVPEGFLVDRAHTGQQALRQVIQVRPDIIVLDSQMPDISGPAVCQHLRDQPDFDPTIPLIITTAGPAGRAERLRAFQAGAWEFFGQPFDGDIVLAKLRILAQTRRAARDLRRRLILDSRTGLYTETGLAHRAAEIASEATRDRQPVACLVLRPPAAEPEMSDLDSERFSTRLADVFRCQGRRADAVGRLGPNEIGMIAPRTAEDGVRAFVVRFGEALREVSPDGPGLRAGYCIAAPGQARAPDPLAMLQRAGSAVRRTSAEFPVLAA